MSDKETNINACLMAGSFMLPESLEYGDVIYIQRSFLGVDTYKHFGLFLSEDKVIHFSNDKSHNLPYVHEAPMSEFLDGEPKTAIVKVRNPQKLAMVAEINRFSRRNKIGLLTSQLLSPVFPFVHPMLFDPREIYEPLYNLRRRLRFVDSVEVEKLIDRLSNIKLYSGEETIKRARDRIGLQTNQMLLSIGINIDEYKLSSNNCEAFALWCKTGDNISTQASPFCTNVVNVIGDIFKNR